MYFVRIKFSDPIWTAVLSCRILVQVLVSVVAEIFGSYSADVIVVDPSSRKK